MKNCRFEDQEVKRNTSKTNRLGSGSIKKSKMTSARVKPKIARKKGVSVSFRVLPQGAVELIAPIITVSEANMSEHWSKGHARHKKQKNLTKLYYLKVKKEITLPCHMHIIRLAPRKLDYDNLVISNKYLVDSLCEELTGDYRPGRADSDPRISITYDQESCKEYGVKIIFDCNPYHSENVVMLTK